MSDQNLTREQLEDQADAALTVAEQLERQMTAAREAFQAALLAGDAVDAVKFSENQKQATMQLVQARLAAARAALALQEHDAATADESKRAALAALDAAELAHKQSERRLAEARGAHSRASGQAQGYAHRQKTLREEIERLQAALLSAVDGRVSTLKPAPKLYSEAPRRAGELMPAPLN